MTSTRLRSTFRALSVFLHSNRSRHTRQSCYSNLAPSAKLPEGWVNAFVSYDNSLSDSEPKCTAPLRGVSVAVKDNICTKQFKTTCSSAMLQDFRPPYDATVVGLLHGAGARIVGKTNCDEFGMGSFNVHSIHGPVVNPYHSAELRGQERRSAGGSSGGSAAAVASGTCHIAIGTDTGGSVRLPAAYCGVSGFKPSYGLISRWGVVSYADSLDCVGILSKDVEDVQLAFDVLSKFDPKDPTSASEEVRRKESQLSEERISAKDDLGDLVIGIPQEYFPEELDESAITPLRHVIARLKSAIGAKVVPVSLPSTPFALSAYYVIASAEASSNLARYSGIHYGLRIAPPPEADKRRISDVYSYSRSEGFGHEVQKRILLGTYALTADAFDNYFLQAQAVRNLVKADFDRVFRSPNPLAPIRHSRGDLGRANSPRVDVLLHPSAVRTAPTLAETKEMDRLEAYVQDVLTVPASLAGLPALSVPAGVAEDGWPVGVSIVGQWGHDNLVLKIGDAIQHIMKA